MKTFTLLLIIALLAFGCDTPADIAPEQYELTYTPLCETGGDCIQGLLITFSSEYSSGILHLEGVLPPGVSVCIQSEYRTGINYDGYFTPDYQNLDTPQYYAADMYVPIGMYLTAWISFDHALPVTDGYTYFGDWYSKYRHEKGYKWNKIIGDCHQ